MREHVLKRLSASFSLVNVASALVEEVGVGQPSVELVENSKSGWPITGESLLKLNMRK